MVRDERVDERSFQSYGRSRSFVHVCPIERQWLTSNDSVPEFVPDLRVLQVRQIAQRKPSAKISLQYADGLHISTFRVTEREEAPTAPTLSASGLSTHPLSAALSRSTGAAFGTSSSPWIGSPA